MLSQLSDLKTPISDDITDSESSSASSEALQLLSASTPLFSTLKRLNRRIYNDLQEQKTNVAEERFKVDSARLALQNLKYEESMLELEVKICQEFQSIYQGIQLHDLQVFHELRAAAGSTEEESLDDDHQLMLARLRFELSERERLEREKQTLMLEKTTVVMENKDKKVKLEQAEKELKDLLAAAQAVQAKFESF